MPANKLQRCFAGDQTAFQLFVFSSSQYLLELRAWRISHLNQIRAVHQQVRGDLFAGPSDEFGIGEIVGGKIPRARVSVDARELKMIFKSRESKEAFQLAGRHFLYFRKARQILNQAEDMLSLHLRKLQAFENSGNAIG